MIPPVVEINRRGFRAPGTSLMVAGSLISAVLAYVFQIYGIRAVGEEAFKPVALLWTIYFILLTVLLVPVEQYVTREVARGRRAIPDSVKPAVLMTLLCAVVGASTVLILLEGGFDGDPRYILIMVLLVVGYGLLYFGKGVLAGSRLFAQVGWVLVIESLGRLAAAVALFVWLGSVVSLAWGMVIGGFAVLILGWWRHDKGSSSEEAFSSSRFLSGYVGGSSSSQLLLGGAPLAVHLLGGSSAMVSIIFVTFTLFRGPLTLIYSLQGRVLPYLVSLSHAGEHQKLTKITRKVVLFGTALALLGGLAGWLFGPTILRFLYDTEPTALVAMLAAAGVMAAAAAQIASQMLVAEGRTRLLGLAWFAGLVAAVVVVLMVTGSPDTRVAIGFASGEAVALGVMGILASRR